MMRSFNLVLLFLLVNLFSCSSDPDPVAYDFKTEMVSKEIVGLEPTASNGTYWMSMFAIGNKFYIIDRQAANNPMWEYDLDGVDEFLAKANFPVGADNHQGLIGSANGKGYVGSHSPGNKFWSYDPNDDEWTPLEDLPFTSYEVNWVAYNGRYYVPSDQGIQEFNPETESWSTYDEVVGNWAFSLNSCFVIGDNLYWFHVNSNKFSRFNFITKVHDEFDFPSDFQKNSSNRNAFVLGDKAYIPVNTTVFEFDAMTNTWTKKVNALPVRLEIMAASVVIGDAAYIVNAPAGEDRAQLFRFTIPE